MDNRKVLSIVYGILSIIVGVILLTPKTYAHILATDGSIGAVVHIEPDDDPIAGELSTFYFDIKDKNGRFDSRFCNCWGIITQDNKELYKQELFHDAQGTKASFTYTFPQRGIYTVKVIGQSSKQNSFEKFTLSYTIRVERITKKTDEQSSQASDRLPTIIGLSMVIIASSIFFMWKRKGVKNS
jgi:hypothetical protein